MSEPSQTTVVAFHEAGHVVVAHLLGDRVEGATIRPGRHYRGVASHTELAVVDYAPAAEAVGQPLPLQPGDLRRWVEVHATIAMAGDEAGLLALTDPPRHATPEGPAPVLQPVPERVRRRWECASDDIPLSDHEVALDACWLVCADWHTRTALMALCTAVARDLVRANAATIGRVARALLEHGELSGPDLITLIEEGDANADPVQAQSA